MIIGMLIFQDMTQLDFTGPHEVFSRFNVSSQSDFQDNGSRDC